MFARVFVLWLAVVPCVCADDFAEFQTSELRCMIGDNAERGEHRAGYSGIVSLTSIHQDETLFVPAYAGINLEHIFHPALNREKREELFEPRNAPMEFHQLDERTAELYQPPTPVTHIESRIRYTFQDPYSIDVEYRCTASEVFDGKPFGVFWASYINAPEDKSIYFLRAGSTIDAPRWQQFCTQYHNHDSTVRWEHDGFRWNFPDEMLGQTLFTSYSKVAYAEPFYYGRARNMVWILMFKSADGVRFAHSPSGGGAAPSGDDTNPAWDFQLIVPQAKAGQTYQWNFRAVYKPWEGRSDVLKEYRKYKTGLSQ